MRRFLFIFGIVLALATVVVALYFLFFRSSEPAPGGSGTPIGGVGSDAGPRDITIPEVGVPVKGAGEEIAPQLIKITDGPVAVGAVAFSIQIPLTLEGTSSPATRPDTEIRYVERASGNIYRFRLTERSLERMTSLTLPGIQEAVWASDGTRTFVRFLETVSGTPRMETYALLASGLDGYFLPPGLSDVVVSGTSSVLSVLPSANGVVATRTTLGGTNPVTLFSSDLASVRTVRAGQGYALITKPSALLEGYVFSVNGGALTRELGPLLGLSALPSPAGSEYLYSYRDGRTLRLGVLDLETRESVTLPVATITEKCVWSGDSLTAYCAVPRTLSGTFPDDWYLGVTQTSDRIWKIDLATRIATLEVDPSVLADEDMDMVGLTLDPLAEVLVFTNRKDGSLWVYDL